MKKWLGLFLTGVIILSMAFNGTEIKEAKASGTNISSAETKGIETNKNNIKKITSSIKVGEKKHYKSGELLLKFDESMKEKDVFAFLTSYEVEFEKKIVGQLYLVRFSEKKHNMESLIEKLNADEKIVFAEPNYIRKKSEIVPEKNYYFNTQWGLYNKKNGIDIDIKKAWELTEGSPSVVVGVIDSGIENNHVDIGNNLWENPDEIPGNGIDDDRNGYTDDVYGWNFLMEEPDSNDKYEHGTHVAGIIAAEDNERGIIGVAPNIRVAALKVGDDSFDTVDIVEAIHYGVKEGIKIFNCSYSSSDFSNAELEAMQSSDVLFICAAGNDGINVDKEMIYPACYKINNIISVGAVDLDGNVPEFSNYGTKNVDIAAPGVDIQSLILSNEYGYGDGTSMAAPFVTGVAALIMSTNKSLGPMDIKKIILENSKVLPSLNKKVAGNKFLDAFAAVRTGMSKEVIAVHGISLNKKSYTLIQHKKIHLKAIVDPWDASNQKVDWSSSDAGVATVDSEGYVFAVRPGKAIIKATIKTDEGDITSSCELNITEPIQPVYKQGDKFRLKIYAPTVTEGKNKAFFIKPDGEAMEFEGNAVADTEEKSGYYYVDIKVDQDGVIGKNEINPQFDYGSWELDHLITSSPLEESICYVNEKYYKTDSTNVNCIFMDDSKFAIKGLKGELLDNTKNILNKALREDVGTKPTVERIEVSRKEAFRGNRILLKIHSKDSSGIWTGKVTFQRPDGTEASYSLHTDSRDGYYYCDLVVDYDGKLKTNEIDSTKYAGLWKVKSLELGNIKGVSEVYYNHEFYTITGVMDMSGADFKVLNNSVSVESLKLYRESGAVFTGKTLRILYDRIPENALCEEIKWTSSNPKVATVSSTGIVMGKNSGITTIIGVLKNGMTHKLQFKVNVRKYYLVKKISVPKKITIGIGKTAVIKANLTPYYATSKKLSWSVLKQGIVKVDGSGKVTGLKKGTAAIKIKALDGSGKYALCYITVK